MKSVSHAWQGVIVLLRTQPNARIHLVATVFVIAASVVFKISAAEWCWMVAAIVAVWSAEAMNTAVESIVDLVSPGHHPLAGRAKDVSAAAVLFVAAGAAIIGVIIFGPRIFQFFS